MPRQGTCPRSGSFPNAHCRPHRSAPAMTKPSAATVRSGPSTPRRPKMPHATSPSSMGPTRSGGATRRAFIRTCLATTGLTALSALVPTATPQASPSESSGIWYHAVMRGGQLTRINGVDIQPSMISQWPRSMTVVSRVWRAVRDGGHLELSKSRTVKLWVYLAPDGKFSVQLVPTTVTPLENARPAPSAVSVMG